LPQGPGRVHLLQPVSSYPDRSDRVEPRPPPASQPSGTPNRSMPIHFPRSVLMAGAMAGLPVTGSAAPPPVERLTVHGRTDPLGIPSGDLSFGWASSSSIRGMKQAAYQVRVGPQPGQDDVWSSGRVDSERQVDVVLPA